MKILDEVDPRYRSTLVIETVTMHGDADCYVSLELEQGDSEYYHISTEDFCILYKILKSLVAYNGIPDYYKELVDFQLLEIHEVVSYSSMWDRYGQLDSVEIYWYDENGRKFNVEIS